MAEFGGYNPLILCFNMNKIFYEFEYYFEFNLR